MDIEGAYWRLMTLKLPEWRVKGRVLGVMEIKWSSRAHDGIPIVFGIAIWCIQGLRRWFKLVTIGLPFLATGTGMLPAVVHSLSLPDFPLRPHPKYNQLGCGTSALASSRFAGTNPWSVRRIF